MNNFLSVTAILNHEINMFLFEEIRNFCELNNLREPDFSFEEKQIYIFIPLWNLEGIKIYLNLNNDCYLKVNTLKYGPGFHHYALSIVEKFSNQFLVDYQLQDFTNYYYSEDFNKLKAYFYYYALEKLKNNAKYVKKYKFGYFNIEDWEFPPILNKNEFATMIGIKSIWDFYNEKYQVRTFSLYDIFPWVDKTNNIDNLMNKSLFNIWNYWSFENKMLNFEKNAQFETVYFLENIIEKCDKKQHIFFPKDIYENIKNKKWQGINQEDISSFKDLKLWDSYKLRNSLVKLGKLKLPIISNFKNFIFDDNYFLIEEDGNSKKCKTTIKLINLKVFEFKNDLKNKYKNFEEIYKLKNENSFLLSKYKKVWTNKYQIITYFSYKKYCYVYEMNYFSKKHIFKEWNKMIESIKNMYFE